MGTGAYLPTKWREKRRKAIWTDFFICQDELSLGFIAESVGTS